jgi:hypothetical protein
LNGPQLHTLCAALSGLKPGVLDDFGDGVDLVRYHFRKRFRSVTHWLHPQHCQLGLHFTLLHDRTRVSSNLVNDAFRRADAAVNADNRG